MEIVDAVFLILADDVEQEAGEADFVGPRLRDHRKIERQRAVMSRARGLFVREDRRKVIGRTARTLEHLAVVVRTVGDLIFAGERLDLPFREAERAGLAERAESDELQRVAGLTDFAIDLETALQLLLVEVTERTGEAP